MFHTVREPQPSVFYAVREPQPTLHRPSTCARILHNNTESGLTVYTVYSVHSYQLTVYTVYTGKIFLSVIMV